jgi:hypothetical protein
VTSVYISVPVHPGERGALRTRAASLLHRIRPLAEDESLERGARMSVRADIDRIEAAATEQQWKPGAVALFACSGREP